MAHGQVNEGMGGLEKFDVTHQFKCTTSSFDLSDVHVFSIGMM